MTTGDIRINLPKPPSPAMGYLRAVAARPRGLRQGEPLKRIEASIKGLKADLERVKKYRAICGFQNDGNLPVTFPHTMAGGAHLTVLTHNAFPYKLLGAVHLRNSIVQYRPIGEKEKLDLQVVVTEQREIPQGVEVDMVTRFFDAKANCVWEGVTVFLIRVKRAGGERKKDGGSSWTPPDFSLFRQITRWNAPENIGRRYGPVAGDINPIHMHPVVAKPFGFKKAIAHGMWTFARCVADTTRDYQGGQLKLEVAFKRPLFLPGKAALHVRDEAGTTEYLLSSPEKETIYLTGTVAMEAAAPKAKRKKA